MLNEIKSWCRIKQNSNIYEIVEELLEIEVEGENTNMSDEVMDYLISIDKRNEIVNEEDENIA